MEIRNGIAEIYTNNSKFPHDICTVNQMPAFEKQEYLPYLLLDSNLTIQRCSELLKQYIKDFQDIAVGKDVRNSFPELVGLEEICAEILNQKQDKFVLESIAREQKADKTVYFDICIQSIQEKLILFFEDVTEVVELRQSFVQKANEVELTVNALKRFEYCTNKIIDSMEEILFITNSEGVIERTNKAVAKLLGYRKSELLAKDINLILQQENFNFAEFYQSLVDRQYSITKIETCLTNKEEQEVEIEFNCFAVPTEIPDLYNCVYIGRDITLRKQTEREMLAALAREKELRELKSRFISMASHEFRNPLSSILICADMLSKESSISGSEDGSFYLQLIKDSALNIQSLLEDVLLLSRAEAGKQTMKPDYLDLKEFCEQIIKQIQLSYPDRVINLITDRDNLKFYGDPKLLWHIFTNLISNALKYSPVTESVDLEIQAQETIFVIEIRDRGIGIPLEAQKHLFDSFYRANNVGETPGTGLGLAIVKRAIDLHLGEIEIMSQPDRGTTVQIRLPHQVPDQA